MVGILERLCRASLWGLVHRLYIFDEKLQLWRSRSSDGAVSKMCMIDLVEQVIKGEVA